MAKRTPGLETAKSILPKAIHALGKKQEQEYYAHWVMWHWKEIVGEAIARHVRPIAIHQKVLRLYAPDSVWANEMRMMMPQVIEAVNRFAGGKMVQEIQFGFRWSQSVQEERAAYRVGKREEQNRRVSVTLSTETIEQISAACKDVQDEAISDALTHLFTKHKQLAALRGADKWHPCASCGALVGPEERLCWACRKKERESLRAAVRAVLRDMPWARFKEIRDFVPGCTPKLVNEQRAKLVQQLAAEVEVTDTKSLAAKTLVMLYACLPPDQLTDDAVRRTIYQLRFDLHRPKDYKAPKRYAIIPLGAKRKE